MNSSRALALFLGAAFAFDLDLRAAEITGTIRDVSGSSVTVIPQGDLAPNVGDKAEVFFKLAGMDEEVSVAAGSVAKVERDSIQLKIENSTGEVAKDQLVRIKSEKPQQRSTLAAAATPSLTPAAAALTPIASANSGQGRNPGFAFVDMNKAFKDHPKTNEAEAEVNAAKNAAKTEYDQRVARKESAGELQAWRAAREKELQEQLGKLRAEIVAEISSTVRQLAGNGINAAFDTSGNTLNGVPLFITTPAGGNMNEAVTTALKGGSAPPVQPARNLRIALVNMEDVFKRFSKTRQAESEINTSRNAARQTYDERATAYSKERAKAEKLSGKARDKQIAKVKKLEGEINAFRTSKEAELQADSIKRREAIVAEIKDVIAKKLGGAGEVLAIDSSGKSLNGIPVVIVKREIPDFSAEIVTALNDTAARTEVPTSALPSTANLRFACVDLDRVFSALPETKRSEAEINAAKEKARAETAGADAAARASKEKELQELAAKLRQSIVDKMTSAIGELGQTAGYNLIFDRSGKSLNGVSLVLSTQGLPDLTEELIARLQ